MKLEGGREGEDQKIRRLGRNLRGCVSQSSVRRTHPPGGQGISQVPWPVVQSVGTGSPRAPYGFFSSNREQQTFRKNVTSHETDRPLWSAFTWFHSPDLLWLPQGVEPQGKFGLVSELGEVSFQQSAALGSSDSCGSHSPPSPRPNPSKWKSSLGCSEVALSLRLEGCFSQILFSAKIHKEILLPSTPKMKTMASGSFSYLQKAVRFRTWLGNEACVTPVCP